MNTRGLLPGYGLITPRRIQGYTKPPVRPRTGAEIAASQQRPTPAGAVTCAIVSQAVLSGTRR